MKTRVSRALRNGRAGALVSSLASIQCLIIDEVDKCNLSKDECAVLFDIVDRKYSNRGMGSMVLTANTQPSAWSEVFQDGRLAECLLDRLFDKSYCFDFEGPSYRGAGKVVSQVNFAGSPALPPRR